MRRGLCPKCQTPTVYRMLNGISYGNAAGVYVRTSWLTASSTGARLRAPSGRIVSPTTRPPARAILRRTRAWTARGQE